MHITSKKIRKQLENILKTVRPLELTGKNVSTSHIIPPNVL